MLNGVLVTTGDFTTYGYFSNYPFCDCALKFSHKKPLYCNRKIKKSTLTMKPVFITFRAKFKFIAKSGVYLKTMVQESTSNN